MINFIGFIIIFYILVFRILRIKFFTMDYTQEVYLLLAFCMTFLFFVFLLFTIFQLLNKKYKLLNNTIVSNKIISLMIHKLLIIYDSPKKVYEMYVFNKINVSYIIEKPVYYLLKYFAKKYKGFFQIIFCSIPKIFTAFLFFYSIFYYNNLYYFYKYIIILLLPLFYNIYLFMIKNLAEKNLKYFIAHLKFEKCTTNSNNLIINFSDIKPNFPDAVDIVAAKNDIKLLNWFVTNYDIYRNIYRFVTTLEHFSKKYSLYENLITYTFYFLGWFHILYMLII
jgi:hypothetical protein